ncbi:MAG: hypothetical protein PHY93_20680 [Bacteriovorax sp.]|nr:hypothetical protein [Bacteriovorax sp.]
MFRNGGADEREHSAYFSQSEVVEILELPSKQPIFTESFQKQKYVVELKTRLGII